MDTEPNMPTDGDKVYRDRNLWMVFLVTFMSILGISSISPILPLISQELLVSPQQVGLLLAVLTLPGVVLSPIFGALGDRIGRKRILVFSLTPFGF